jgi:transposase
MRATRDLLRRRTKLVRVRAEALAHVQNTFSQYNLPLPAKQLRYAGNRDGVVELFSDQSVQRMVQTDFALVEHIDEQVKSLELYLTQHAKIDDPQSYYLLQTIPGIGRVLALVLLYEMHEAARFGDERHFVSYCRLVRPVRESAGKKSGSSGHKIGNAHLRWAFGEAACLMLRELPAAQAFVAKKEKLHGKAKAISILAARIARTAWLMLKRKEAFDATRFLN